MGEIWGEWVKLITQGLFGLVCLATLLPPVRRWVAQGLTEGLVTRADLDQHLARLDNRLGELSSRVTACETSSTLLSHRLEAEVRSLGERLDTMPRHQDIAALRSEVATVGATVNAINDQLRLLVEHHLRTAS